MSSFPKLPSVYRIAQILLDALVAFGAILFAFTIRFEGNISNDYWALIDYIWFIGVPTRLLIYGCFGVYRQIWRLFSLRDFWAIFQATSFYSLLLVLITRLVLPKLIILPALPLGVAVMDWSFCLLGMTLLRFLRVYQIRRNRPYPKRPMHHYKRCLLLGAGKAGAQIVQETRQNASLQIQVVGFLDDDFSKHNRQVEGVKVMGPISELAMWAERLKVNEVLITIPSATSDRIQQIVSLAKTNSLAVKIIPPVQELWLDRDLTRQIREIRLEDLLGRPEILLDFDQVLTDKFPSAAAQVKHRTVLVTGAGGTIGSEICRQLSRLQPRRLILLGRGENSIFQIDQELRSTFPHLQVVPIIADVRNEARISEIFHEYTPDVVFHAAAHKHVPLMELHPTEAIENNTIASANLALLADKVGVSTFVLISTDKAVAPTNFMGLSKRLAETLVSAIAQESRTRFLSVRFGNVLGSRGSVIPIFQQQIEKGGPVTVTDPEMTRYFMTTPEASRLVIQSMAVGETGQTLVLDMGKPVRIYALAEQLIRLRGYSPEDIEIKITGIRPGEKLHESLVDQDELVTHTAHPRIFCLVKKRPLSLSVSDSLNCIKGALKCGDCAGLWASIPMCISPKENRFVD